MTKLPEECTVPKLIEYLQELLELNPELADYQIAFEDEGLWYGTSFQCDRSKTLQLECS